MNFSIKRRTRKQPKLYIPTRTELEEACENSALAYSKCTDKEKELYPTLTKLPLRRVYSEVKSFILYLWRLDSKVFLSKSEAVEKVVFFTKDSSKDMKSIIKKAWEYLHRYRHINFGLFSPGRGNKLLSKKAGLKVIVIGSGIAGISTARELENIFIDSGHNPPELKILEARHRVGGRMFTFPLHHRKGPNTVGVDLAAQIVTGFEGGNPMDVIIRKQLKLHLHYLEHADTCPIHDTNGDQVTEESDLLSENVFNEVLEDACNTLFIDGHPRVVDSSVKQKACSSDYSKSPLKQDTASDRLGDILYQNTKAPPETPSLGEVMDWHLQKHPDFSRLMQGQNMRLVHWHKANLEFANATNLDKLSLHHWDQDDDNEFKGFHAMIRNGYGQVPKALHSGVSPCFGRVRETLLTEFGKIVTKIAVSPCQLQGSLNKTGHVGKVNVTVEGGETESADCVVITVPLGVLKASPFAFEPSLPECKTRPIQRMGFGWFNKVVLVFPRTFWDISIDSFGSLGSPGSEGNHQSYDSEYYAKERGRFFLFWNLVPTTGLPVLVAFVSGTAAVEMEGETDNVIVDDALSILSRIFKNQVVPPVETIVTRWSRDRFSRGSYSYVANGSNGSDYDDLSLPIWNKIFWGGEATNRQYPATVHGAYMSGMRVATEIADRLLGSLSEDYSDTDDDDEYDDDYDEQETESEDELDRNVHSNKPGEQLPRLGPASNIATASVGGIDKPQLASLCYRLGCEIPLLQGESIFDHIARHHNDAKKQGQERNETSDSDT